MHNMLLLQKKGYVIIESEGTSINIKSGFTGLAHLEYPVTIPSTTEDIERQYLDAFNYMYHQSLWFDLKIIVRAIVHHFRYL